MCVCVCLRVYACVCVCVCVCMCMHTCLSETVNNLCTVREEYEKGAYCSCTDKYPNDCIIMPNGNMSLPPLIGLGSPVDDRIPSVSQQCARDTLHQQTHSADASKSWKVKRTHTHARILLIGANYVVAAMVTQHLN